jgi:Zn-dependent protease
MARHVLLGLSGAAIGLSVWLLGWKLAVVLSAGLLVHEFGHALVAWLYTGRLPPMVLIPPFFGLTFASSMSGRPAGQILALKMGGVWFSLLVCLALMPLASSWDLLYAGIAYSLVNNALNLLPIPGLDGGGICLYLIRGRSLGGRFAIAAAMLAAGVAFGVWAASTFVWVMLGLTSITLLLRARRVPGPGEAPELPDGAVLAWVGAQALTFTVLLHVAWVLLSLGNPMERIGRVLS